MGEGVLGLSLGGDQGFSSSFFSAFAGASAARTTSFAARGVARDTDLAVFAAFAASRLATALGATVARTEEQDTADILERDEGGS